ncbi:MAG: selenoneine biosynthesis selenosugar synthase SenB [Planctomycetota bacterium]
MNVEITTPAPRGARTGNRITALRWAGMLRGLGARVRVVTEHRHLGCDLYIALHARASHSSIRAIHEEAGKGLLLVALTGTDLYVDLDRDSSTLHSLRLADRIVTLQPRAAEKLPAELVPKVVVIPQSSSPPDHIPERPRDRFQVLVVAHLRAVKDSLRTARAARLLPAASRIQVTHLGAALSADLEAAALEETRSNPRYEWLGLKHRRETLERLAGAHLMVQSSLSEGGSNTVSEALVCATPVLSSRAAGSVGMLGPDYPGLFDAGDEQALAGLLRRAETDPDFYHSLERHCARLAPTYSPARERAQWAAILAEVRES